MKFCKYCGKQLVKGSTCSCTKVVDEQEEVLETEEALIDLGLEETKVIDSDEITITYSDSEKEAKIIEIEEDEYIYCSNCGKKKLVDSICECQKNKETIKNDIDDSIKSIKDFLNNFFKSPKTSITNYIKSDNLGTNIFIIALSIIVITLTSVISSIFTPNLITNHFGISFININTLGTLLVLIKTLIKTISFIIVDIVVSYLVIKHIFKKEDTNMKDIFSLVALSLLPVIIFELIAFILGIINITISGYISTIGTITKILFLEHGIRYYFKLDDDKILLSILSIFSLTSIINFVIILIVN